MKLASGKKKVSITDLWSVRFLRSIDSEKLAQVCVNGSISKLTAITAGNKREIYQHIKDKLSSSPEINYEDTPVEYIRFVLKGIEDYFTDPDLVEIIEPERHLGWKKFAQHMGLNTVQQQIFVLAAEIHYHIGAVWNSLSYYGSSSVDPVTNTEYRWIKTISPNDFHEIEVEGHTYSFSRILVYPSTLVDWLAYMLNSNRSVVNNALFPTQVLTLNEARRTDRAAYRNSPLSLLVKLGCYLHSEGKVEDIFTILVPTLPTQALGAIADLHLGKNGKSKVARLFAKPIRKTKLTEKDFDFVQFDHVVDYLQGSLDSRAQGVNVLVYGPPGTGKSEFVRMLSQHLDAGFVEVPTDDNTTSLEIGNRLAKVKTAELLLKQARGVLVVDEAEDIFSNTTYSSFLEHSPTHHSKHLLNEFLETSQTPIIWIVNNRGMIDPAFRRRCDAIIKIDKLPVKARRKIIQKHTHGLTGPASWKDELAKNKTLTPADIGSAARMAKLAGHKKEKAVQTMERALSTRLEERDGKQLKSAGPKSKLLYQVDWLNTDADMHLVLEQLSAGADARFCFYGSPGTGKTAFARHAAEQAGLPLVEKRASDLLSKWVGQSEQNIAEAFHDAKSEGAILLIDEVDSFLQSRSGANHSWEVSMVNELLTQMESFSGTLVCCTNLMDGIDEAAFRRFDVKIQFKPLTYEQATEMLMGMGVKVDETASHQLRKMPLLTPGDFAAVQRRFQFLSKAPTVQSVLAELQKEVAHKKGGRKKIGF